MHQQLWGSIFQPPEKRLTVIRAFCSTAKHKTPRAAINRIAGQQRAHTPGQGLTSCADQQMKVIRQRGPGVHRQGLRFDRPGQPLDEILPIGVILKEPLPRDPPRYHMVQHTGGIQSGTTRQSAVLTITRISLQRPLCDQQPSNRLNYEARLHQRVPLASTHPRYQG